MYECLKQWRLALTEPPTKAAQHELYKSCVNWSTAKWHRIANETARTIAGRENGGNCDIKNLSRGSRIYLLVFVEGVD
jgi:acetamidase/formamidase